jgi:hypothetical protein
MCNNILPKFVIKKNLQKSAKTGVFFSDHITQDILKDVCTKVTGQVEFETCFVDNNYVDDHLQNGYNKGRLAILYYNGTANYISFSEKDIGGRNSSVQSVPTAYNMFYLNPYTNKAIYYYFLCETGNADTDYHILIYRLMKTVG